MRISVFTREERQRKEGEKISFFFPAVFSNLLLDQIQFNGDLTYFSDEEVPKASVFIRRRPDRASISISAPRMSK